MKLSRPAIALYVGLIFASGGVLGVFGQRLYNASTASAKEIKTPPSPDEFRKRVIAEYQRRLELTDDQLQKLNLILDETQARFNEIHAKTVPELQAVHQEQIDHINGMLTPTQQPKYEAMRKERQEQRQKQRGGRPGGGPGF
jgi:Spy/CpxP family protein refolding chaperone